jgi:hypothetical protein
VTGGLERERPHEPSTWGPRAERRAGAGAVPRVASLSPRASAGTEAWGGHVPDARRKRRAALLASPGADVRQVWRPGRRPLAGPRRPRSPAAPGQEAEVSRRAAAVAQRRRQGPQHPAGARPAGRRGDAPRPRSAPSGGEPGRRTCVLQAGANAERSAGRSGRSRKGGARRRKGPARPVWGLSWKPDWGKPTVRHVRGGGWKRGDGRTRHPLRTRKSGDRKLPT